MPKVKFIPHDDSEYNLQKKITKRFQAKTSMWTLSLGNYVRTKSGEEHN